jgi:hypothetical protein
VLLSTRIDFDMTGSLLFLPLFADAGVPMLFLTLPAMLLLLIPIIVCRRLPVQKMARHNNVGIHEIKRCFKSGFHGDWCAGGVGNHAWRGIRDDGGSGVEVPKSKLEQSHRQGGFFSVEFGMDRPARQKLAMASPGSSPCPAVPFFLASYGIEYLVISYMVGSVP